MNNIKYVVTSCIIQIEELSACSYGIACMQNAREIISMEDVSLDKAVVEEAVRCFNLYELSPDHFEEAIEDVVADSATYKL